MAGPMSGPGVGLQPAQYLYPSELTNAPPDFSTNRLCLAPGQAVPLPRGDYYIDTSDYCIVQFQDNCNNGWNVAVGSAWRGGFQTDSSDGFTFRIGNFTGCPIAGVVTAGGNGYAQSTISITPAQGTSTWQGIVGGALALTSVTAQGLGYGIAPLVFIPAPPGPATNPNGVGGVQAAAFAVLTGTSVTGISFTCVGAGYPTAPTATIIPSPYDPNLLAGTAITNATCTLALTGANQLTAAICTNSGAPVTDAQVNANISINVSAGTTQASVTALTLMTLKAYSVLNIGAGYTANTVITTAGGGPIASSPFASPTSNGTGFRPRQALVIPTLISTSLSTIKTMVDPGLFVSVPIPVILQSVGNSTAATIVLELGSAADQVILQPLRV